MKSIYFLSFAICFSCVFYCIGCSNPTNLSIQVTTTGRAACDSQISYFNRSSSYQLIRDIKRAQAAHRLTPEIKALYPEARDQWNAELKRFKRNYTRTLTVSLTELPASIKSSSDMNGLENYQKFFVLLTEASLGNYPYNSVDMDKVENWLISADPFKSLKVIFGKFQNGDCVGADLLKVRQLLNPQLMPDRIEQCF